MIPVETRVRSMQGDEIATIWLRHVPRIGERLWLYIGSAFGPNHDGYVVRTVDHIADPIWSPQTHEGHPPHQVILYVEAMDT